MNEIEPKNQMRGKRMPNEIKAKIPHLIDEVGKMLGENLNKKQIADRLSKKISPEHVTINFVNKLVIDANKKMTSKVNRSMSYVFNLHVKRYEKIYFDCMEDIKDWRVKLEWRGRHFKLIRTKILLALKAMKQKEELLGMHDNSMEVNIGKDSVSVKRKRSHKEGHIPYRIDALTHDEKKELLNFIKKASLKEVDGIHPLIFKKRSESDLKIINKKIDDNQDIKDITFEEMPDGNVHEFKKSDSKELETVTSTPAKSLDDVINKIRARESDILSNFLNSKK